MPVRRWPRAKACKVGAVALAGLSILGALCVPARGSSAQPGLRAPRRFELSAAPTVVIADDGSAERAFRRVLARRMPNGHLVVGEPDEGAIRVFDRSGRVLRVLARKGKGPGEIPGPFALTSIGDTLLSLGQPPLAPAGIALFTETAGYVGQVRADELGASSVAVVDRLTTGQYLVRRSKVRFLRTAPDIGRLYPDTTTYGLLSMTVEGTATATVNWLAPVVYQWTFAHPWPGGPLATMLFGYPFAPITFVVASGDRVWVVRGDDGAVSAYGPGGASLASMKLSGAARAFDDRVLAARRAQALAESRRTLDSVRANAMFARSLLPSTMPWVSAALAGPDGEVWLRRFNPMASSAQVFVVIDRDGHEIAEASIPADVEVQQIGRDFLVAVRTSTDGTLAVLEYALRR